MICAICKKGTTKPGFVTVTLQRGESTVVIKDVPADVCANCGEYYLSVETSERVMHIGEEAVARGVQVEVSKYVA